MVQIKNEILIKSTPLKNATKLVNMQPSMVIAAINHFKSKNLNDSTVRTFKSKYCVELKDAAIKNVVQRKY